MTPKPTQSQPQGPTSASGAPNADTDPARSTKSAVNTEVVLRTIIFATQTAASDIPVPADFPASLLPVGPMRFIERVLSELCDLGIRDVDLVVSDQPETLRQCLGNGERWGITVRWHLVKTANTPYAMLRHVGSGAQRMLVGHADHWVAAELLQQLLTHNTCVVNEATQQWCGWASLPGKALASVNSDTDMTMLSRLINTDENLQRLQAAPQSHACGGDAAQLLAVQQQALALQTASIPDIWVRTLWGAMSPDACVSANAVMQGPVLVGPGCFIHADAHVGPNVVLDGDVIVASGASVSNSLVMSGTFLGGGVALLGAIARGNLIQKVGSGERIHVAESEGSMLLHTELQPVAVVWMSRLFAAISLALLTPWFLLDLVFRGCVGAPKRWRPYTAAVATPHSPASPQLLELRAAPLESTAYGKLAWYFGGLLDVLQGRRCWFGIRPRSVAEWMALSSDWQRIFTHASVGLFHAPAWSDPDPYVQLESFAVADAYMSVQRNAWQRFSLCCAIVLGSAQPKAPAVTPPIPSLDLSRVQPQSRYPS